MSRSADSDENAEPDALHLLEHGFTLDELEAIAESLSFAVTLGEAGETGAVGNLGGDVVKWTPEKRRVLEAYLDAWLAWSRKDGQQ